MTLPLDGAISKFYKEEIPDNVREAIRHAGKDDILAESYPYDTRMDRDDYDDTMERLQVELMKLQAWVKNEGNRDRFRGARCLGERWYNQAVPRKHEPA